MFEHTLKTFVAPSILSAAPEIFLIVMACVILLLDIAPKTFPRAATFALTQVSLLGCALIILVMAYVAGSAGRFSGGYPIFAFNDMFVRDPMGDILKFLTCLTVSITLFYSHAYIKARQAIPKGEYLVISVLATLGMLVMISANHFLPLYLGLEMLSLSLYAMTALNRNSAISVEAAMKYFVLGALASGMLLYGMSMIYGATGSLDISQIAAALYENADVIDKTVLTFGLVFLIVGLAFKLGLVPFHMWIPDVYQGAPTSVTLFIAAAPKLAAFAITMRLLVIGLISLSFDWQSMLIVLAVLSIIVGNLLAIRQHNIKRMLAYSAIAHMGFMLMGIFSGIVKDSILYNGYGYAYASALFYVITYALTTLAGFGLIMLLSRAGFEADELEDFKGLGQRNPCLALMMMITMLSLAGIPPFVGFFAKLFVLEAVVAAGHYWIAVIAVIFSLVGAFYYLRVIKLMYFDAPKTTEPIQRQPFVNSLMMANTLAVALLGILSSPLLALCDFCVRFHFSG